MKDYKISEDVIKGICALIDNLPFKQVFQIATALQKELNSEKNQISKESPSDIVNG